MPSCSPCRDNHRISFQDPELANQLWTATGLRDTLQGVTVDDRVPIGLNPNLRFYRYTRGQKFGKHIDDSVEVAPGQHTGECLGVEVSRQRCIVLTWMLMYDQAAAELQATTSCWHTAQTWAIASLLVSLVSRR